MRAVVERCQRLVHQDQARAGEQGAADRDALLLAARQQARPAVEQMADAEQLDHAVHVAVAFGGRREEAAVAQILPDRHMREQPRVLEDVADAAPVLGHEDARSRIGQHAPIGDDPALVRAQQPADQIDQRGLARARRAEQRGQPPARLEGRVEREGAEPVADVDLEAHSTSIRLPTRRASTSEAISATMAMTIEMRVRRSAPASPPGTWVKV